MLHRAASVHVIRKEMAMAEGESKKVEYDFAAHEKPLFEA